MSLFEINFLSKMSGLLKEAFKFKKYKAMHPVLAVFTGIFMIPIVLFSFALIVWFAVLGFAFSVLSSPAKFLHSLTTIEGKQVQHATQAIIYLISWPFVFMIYALMSFLLIIIFPLYALLSIFTYIWSLGGFKFHLFPNKVDDISIEVTGTYGALPPVYIIVSSVLLILAPIVHGAVCLIALYYDYREALFPLYFADIYSNYITLSIYFSILYSLIGFARFPKREKLDDPTEITE